MILIAVSASFCEMSTDYLFFKELIIVFCGYTQNDYKHQPGNGHFRSSDTRLESFNVCQ